MLEGALKLFFELRDRKYIKIVEDLFNMYYIQDIAHGIHIKYGVLPAGWKDHLTLLKQGHDSKLSWLNLSKILWYSESTESYPSVYLRPIDDALFTQKYEKIVDEFISNERKYFKKLHAFVKYYVCEVQAIAENKIGPKARKSLGMNKEQVEHCFGILLPVYRAVDSLLISLEALTLVPCQTKVPCARVEHLARVLMTEGEKAVNAYAPYNARYQMAKRLIEVKADSVSESQLGEGDIMKHLNFFELWQEIAQSRAELKSMALDSILIMPIRRFPNYKVFVARLQKDIPDGHPILGALGKCFEKVDGYTRKIDDTVRAKQNTELAHFNRLTTDFY